MRLNRSDAGQNGRATSICKAYAKRTSSLQAASDQHFIGRSEIFAFGKCPKNGILLPSFGTRSMTIVVDEANVTAAVYVVNFKA
jgi:hypothetical protein